MYTRAPRRCAAPGRADRRGGELVTVRGTLLPVNGHAGRRSPPRRGPAGQGGVGSRPEPTADRRCEGREGVDGRSPRRGGNPHVSERRARTRPAGWTRAESRRGRRRGTAGAERFTGAEVRRGE